MATINLTGEDFEKTVLKDGIVFVDFWAAWCGPCRIFGPIFEQASEKHPEITFAKVDTDAEQSLAGAAGISSIPTLMAFRDGILIYREAGALPGPQFDELIAAVQNVNMDEVRAEIEKDKKVYFGDDFNAEFLKGLQTKERKPVFAKKPTDVKPSKPLKSEKSLSPISGRNQRPDRNQLGR